MYRKEYLIKNTPGVKTRWPRTKTGFAEKDVKSNGRPMPPGFDTFESLVMMNSLQNTVISGVQGLLMLMGSKFLINMTRPQNIKIKTVFCGLVTFIKNFDPINIRRS